MHISLYNGKYRLCAPFWVVHTNKVKVKLEVISKLGKQVHTESRTTLPFFIVNICSVKCCIVPESNFNETFYRFTT